MRRAAPSTRRRPHPPCSGSPSRTRWPDGGRRQRRGRDPQQRRRCPGARRARDRPRGRLLLDSAAGEPVRLLADLRTHEIERELRSGLPARRCRLRHRAAPTRRQQRRLHGHGAQPRAGQDAPLGARRLELRLFRSDTRSHHVRAERARAEHRDHHLHDDAADHRDECDQRAALRRWRARRSPGVRGPGAHARRMVGRLRGPRPPALGPLLRRRDARRGPVRPRGRSRDLHGRDQDRLARPPRAARPAPALRPGRGDAQQSGPIDGDGAGQPARRRPPRDHRAGTGFERHEHDGRRGDGGRHDRREEPRHPGGHGQREWHVHLLGEPPDAGRRQRGDHDGRRRDWREPVELGGGGWGSRRAGQWRLGPSGVTVYLGDYSYRQAIVFRWYTTDASGAATAPTTAGTLKVYLASGGSTTSLAVTLTDSRNIGGLVGVHECTIAANAALLTPGAGYIVQLEGAVIAGVTVNAVLAQFGVLDRIPELVWSGAVTVTDPTDVVLGTSQGIKPGDLLWFPVIPSASPLGYAVITGYTAATGAATLATALDASVVTGSRGLVLSGLTLPPVQEADFATDALSARVLKADAATEIATAVGTLSIADGALTEAKFATDALSARVLKADAVTEIQAGLVIVVVVASVQADTDNIQTRLPAALVGGKMDSVADVNAGSVTTIQTGLATAVAVAAVQADTDNIQTRLPAALVTGKMDSVAAITLDSTQLTAIADQVWDYLNKIEPGVSPKAALRVVLAYCAGLTTGFQGASPIFRSVNLSGNVVQGTKSRISGVMSSTGERSSATLDLSDV